MSSYSCIKITACERAGTDLWCNAAKAPDDPFNAHTRSLSRSEFQKCVKTKTAPHVILCDSQYLVLSYVRKVSLSQTGHSNPLNWIKAAAHQVLALFMLYTVTLKGFGHVGRTLKMS